MKVCPSIVENELTLLFDEDMIGCKFSLIDMQGNKLVTDTIQKTEYSVDMTQMPPGLYLISVVDKVQQLFTKGVKKE